MGNENWNINHTNMVTMLRALLDDIQQQEGQAKRANHGTPPRPMMPQETRRGARDRARPSETPAAPASQGISTAATIRGKRVSTRSAGALRGRPVLFEREETHYHLTTGETQAFWRFAGNDCIMMARLRRSPSFETT